MALDLPTGGISVKYGQMNASSDTIMIKVKGDHAHGATSRHRFDRDCSSCHYDLADNNKRTHRQMSMSPFLSVVLKLSDQECRLNDRQAHLSDRECR